MTAERSLARYHRRRDFSKTAEPEGRLEELSDEPPSYVVQIHDARSMHFDFRLEADGVLKSFAVPKGPSKDPHDKRFATPTEWIGRCRSWKPPQPTTHWPRAAGAGASYSCPDERTAARGSTRTPGIAARAVLSPDRRVPVTDRASWTQRSG
ncbi:DNA polymerase ligase N-terminal domain-containing protein [Streptomyces sp. M-16]|uniref:DNA polymerase ligase N-terminal domain-containing protein n=1 Tax=Streptomyces sp. M-16 TaxID=3233040 RepID=UPI003F9C76A8